VQRRTLFSQVPQNPALDDWVKQGIDLVIVRQEIGYFL
jgi:hypothetical protein